MGLIFTGNDIIGEDDPGQSPWVTNGTSVSQHGTASGPGETASYEITVTDTDTSNLLNAKNLTVSENTYHGFVWIRKGSTDTADGGVLSSGWQVNDEEILHGPGKIEIGISGRWEVTGLRDYEWTLIKFAATMPIAGSDPDFLIYPGTASDQDQYDSVVIGPCRLALASESPGWSYDTPPNVIPSDRRTHGPGIELDDGYAENTSPHSSMDLAASQTYTLNVRRGEDGVDMTLLEKEDDADNRLNIWYDESNDYIIAYAELSGTDISAHVNTAGYLPVGVDTELAVVLPETGNAQIYVNGVLRSTSTTGTRSSEGSGVSIGARLDGSEPFKGAWHEGLFFNRALTASELSRVTRAGWSRLPTALA